MKEFHKKFLISVAVTILALSLCVGLSFAWFTGSAQIEGNSVSVGSLSFEIYGDTQEAESVENFISASSPIWSKTYPVKITNTGSLPGLYDLKLDSTGLEELNLDMIYIEVYDNSPERICLAANNLKVLMEICNGVLLSGEVLLPGESSGYDIKISTLIPLEGNSFGFSAAYYQSEDYDTRVGHALTLESYDQKLPPEADDLRNLNEDLLTVFLPAIPLIDEPQPDLKMPASDVVTDDGNLILDEAIPAGEPEVVPLEGELQDEGQNDEGIILESTTEDAITVMPEAEPDLIEPETSEAKVTMIEKEEPQSEIIEPQEQIKDHENLPEGVAPHEDN